MDHRITPGAFTGVPMIISVSQFRRLAQDIDGNVLPLGENGGDYLGTIRLTATGATGALHDDARFVRIATDTAVSADIYGTTPEFLPAGDVEFFPVRGGQTITFS